MMKYSLFILLVLAVACTSNREQGQDPIFAKINSEVLENSTAYADLKEETSVIGHRLTGSDNGHKAEQFVYDKLLNYGFNDVQFQEFEVEAWSRGTVSFTLDANGRQADIPVVSLGHSPVEANVTAGVIDMGNGLAADYENIGDHLQGKFALVYIGILPNSGEGLKNLHRSEKAKLAIDHGAAGIIIFNQVPNGVLLTGTASVTGELLTAPAVCIGYEDGLTIKEMLADNPAAVKVTISMTNQSGLIKARNVIATLPGVALPDEEVIIGGHLDSWDLATGAIDNGIGSFAVLDIARTFIANNLTPKRTVKFVFFMGEEQGLLGSRAFVKQALADNTLDRIKLMMNMDMVGNPIGINVAGKAIDTTFFAQLNHKINTIDTLYQGKFSMRAGLHSDHQPFMLQGIPVMSMHSNLDRSIYKCYHADCDDFSLVNKEHTVNTTRFATMALYEIANSDQLPAARMSSEETRQFMIDKGLEENLKMQGDWQWE